MGQAYRRRGFPRPPTTAGIAACGVRRTYFVFASREVRGPEWSGGVSPPRASWSKDAGDAPSPKTSCATFTGDRATTTVAPILDGFAISWYVSNHATRGHATEE